MAIGRAIQQFIERVRYFRNLAQSIGRDARLETLVQLGLQEKGWDQRDQIGVAAALAEAIQGALNLPGAGAHRRQGIGDRVFGVVMGVNAEMVAGNDCDDLADDALDLVGQCAAIGVA